MGRVHEPGLVRQADASRLVDGSARERCGHWVRGRRRSGAWAPSWTWASTRVMWRCFSARWPRTAGGRRRAARRRGCLPRVGCWTRTQNAPRRPGSPGRARKPPRGVSCSGLLLVACVSPPVEDWGFRVTSSGDRSPARWPRRGRGWRVPVPPQCCCDPAGLLAHEQGGAGRASAQPRGSAPASLPILPAIESDAPSQ